MANYKFARLAAYTITSWLAVIATAASLNALIKARQDRTADAALAIAQAPIPGFRINIDLDDILTSGGFLSAGEILLGLVSFFSSVFLLFPSLQPVRSFSERHGTHGVTNGARGFVLGVWIFSWVWTLASAAITTQFGRHRSAKVTAFAGDEPIPDEVIKVLEAANGVSPVYWTHGYTKFLVAAPWPLLFFGLISMILTYLAYSKSPYNSSSTSPNGAYPLRGGSVEKTENGSLNKQEMEERLEDGGRRV